MEGMHNDVIGQTCVLKVNINCCEACPVKLRKKLMKCQGVSSIHVDKENDLVIVSGNIDPTKLVEEIRKIVKKNSEIVSYVGGYEDVNEAEDTIRGRVFGNAPAAAATRGYYDYQPAMYARRLPPLPLGDHYYYEGPTNLPPPLPPVSNPYYKQRDPTHANSVFHSFNEDNTNACTIM